PVVTIASAQLLGTSLWFSANAAADDLARAFRADIGLLTSAVQLGFIAGTLRFLVGCCLAGIYPLGMKLIVGWAPDRAGAALAWLVGMLTLGTALPHAMRALGGGWDWREVLVASSLLALVAAAMVHAL